MKNDETAAGGVFLQYEAVKNTVKLINFIQKYNTKY